MSVLGPGLEKLIQIISRFPGMGIRSAQRVALHLLKHKSTVLEPLIEQLHLLQQAYRPCRICGHFDERDPCFFCTSPIRDPSLICVVAETGDIWALERAAFFKGRYHVLGGLLSSFEHFSPECLNLDDLLTRLRDPGIREVVLALNSHIEGQTTLHYLTDELAQKAPQVKVSALARGIPMGGELSYLDHATLMSAFVGRRDVQPVALPGFS